MNKYIILYANKDVLKMRKHCNFLCEEGPTQASKTPKLNI